MRFIKLISLGFLFNLILDLGLYKRDIFVEGTNPLLTKDSWVHHLVRLLCKRPFIKAIRVTFFIKSYIFWAFPPPLVFQILHIFQGRVTHHLYTQLQLTYWRNIVTSLKYLRSVPNVLFSCPFNDSLVSFVIIIPTNEFCPLLLSHPFFIWLIILHLLPFSITSL